MFIPSLHLPFASWMLFNSRLSIYAKVCDLLLEHSRRNRMKNFTLYFCDIQRTVYKKIYCYSLLGLSESISLVPPLRHLEANLALVTDFELCYSIHFLDLNRYTLSKTTNEFGRGVEGSRARLGSNDVPDDSPCFVSPSSVIIHDERSKSSSNHFNN